MRWNNSRVKSRTSSEAYLKNKEKLKMSGDRGARDVRGNTATYLNTIYT